MVAAGNITLSNNAEIEEATSRLLQFCEAEYDYYDGLQQGDPNRIEPIDVLVTFAVSSRIQGAKRLRHIHREMARCCDPILAKIPTDSELLTCPESTRNEVKNLIETADQIPYVGLAVSTKILHRKRSKLIPMFDSVVVKEYLKANQRYDFLDRNGEPRQTIPVAILLEYFSNHLQSVSSQIDFIRLRLNQAGYLLSSVRILDILVWTELEPNYYYRDRNS